MRNKGFAVFNSVFLISSLLENTRYREMKTFVKL